MTGLGLFAAGFAIVLVDVRIDGFDLVSDPVGWVMALVGLLGLTRLHEGFKLAAASAVAAAVVSLGTVLGETPRWLSAIETVVLTGVVFGTCTAIRALSASPRDRQAAQVIRWADLGFSVIALVLTAAADGATVQVDGAATGPFVVLVLGALAVAVWFLVLTWRVRREPAFASAPVS